MRYKDFINNNTNNDEYSQYIDYIDAYLHETINILADKKALIILQGLEGEKYKDKLSASKDRASVMIVWVSDKLNKEYNISGAEMEAFALFYNAKLLNKKASCILTVVDSYFYNENISADARQNSLNQMIKLGLESAIRL